MAGKSLLAKYLLDPSGVRTGVGEARAELGKLNDDTGKIGDEADRMTGRLGGMFSNLAGVLSNNGIIGAEAVQKLGDHFDKADSKGKGFFQTLSTVGGASLLGLGAAAVAAGVEGVKLAEGFDSATSRIAASAGISQKAAKSIGDAFLNTAGSVTFNGTQIAQAYAGVAGQLGEVQGHALNSKQALDVMSASMSLAEATGTGLSGATSDLASVMQAFGIQAAGAASASDVLYSSANLTGSSIDAVSSTFAKLHGALGIATPDIGQLGGILVDLANHGETGRKALSAVNTALTGLLTPTAAASKAQEELGVSVFGAGGKFVGFGSLLSQLQPKLAGMSEQQQLATLKSIGLGSASKALLATINSGPAAFDKATSAVSRTGAAHDAAEKSTDNLKGQTEKLKATAEDLGTKLGEVLIPKLELVAQETSKVIGWFLKHKGAAEALAGIVGGALAVAMGAFAINTGTKLVHSLQDAGKAVSKLGTMMLEKLVPTSSAVSDAFAVEGESAEAAGAATDAAFGPIGLILAGVSIAAMLLVTHWKQVSKFLVDVWHDIDSVAKSVWNGITSFFKKWGEDILLVFLPVVGIPVFLATHWHKVEQDAKQIWGDITSFFSKIPGEIMKGLSALVGDLEGLAKDAWKGFLKGLQIGEAVLKAYYVTIPTKILTWLGDATLWLVQTAWNAVKGFWNGFVQAEVWLGGQIRTIGGKIEGWLSDAGTWLLHTGAEVLSGLWNGVVAGWQLLGSINATILGWFTSALSSAVSWLVQTGKDVITGLWNGISSMGSWLYQQVSSFATNFVKGAIHDALSIFSPSRVTFQSGVYVAQGLAQGILSGSGLVEAASKSLATSATNGLGGLSGATFKVGTSAGLGATPAGGAVSGASAGGGVNVNVYVTVQGSVSTEKELADFVRQELLAHAVVNGTLLGVNG